NLGTTREKARQRMQLLRSRAPCTAESMAKAAQKHYARDTDHCESLRKRKFVAKFGEDAFFDFYLPQHKLRGADFLPGLAREYAQYLEKHDWPVEKGGMKGAQQDGKQVEKGGKRPSAIKRPGSRPNCEARKDMILDLKKIVYEEQTFIFTRVQVYLVEILIANTGSGHITARQEPPASSGSWVLGHGLFTKKTDADAVAGSSKVLIFFTRNEAREKWAKYCLRRHTHGGDGEVVPDSEDGDGASASSDKDGASIRSVSPTLGRQTRVAGCCCAPHPFANGTQGHPSPKNASHRAFSVPAACGVVRPRAAPP
ncbi:hypothetical protein B0H14DRAFT_2573283, partial [Mycena olivaceomarginata]